MDAQFGEDRDLEEGRSPIPPVRGLPGLLLKASRRGINNDLGGGIGVTNRPLQQHPVFHISSDLEMLSFIVIAGLLAAGINAQSAAYG